MVKASLSLCLSQEWHGYDGANPAVTMYEEMFGETLSWKVPSPRQSVAEPNPEVHFTGDGGATKILKVCFCTNNNLGKNFKLVKCDSSWQIRVRTEGQKSWSELICEGSGLCTVFELQACAFSILNLQKNKSTNPVKSPLWMYTHT